MHFVLTKVAVQDYACMCAKIWGFNAFCDARFLLWANCPDARYCKRLHQLRLLATHRDRLWQEWFLAVARFNFQKERGLFNNIHAMPNLPVQMRVDGNCLSRSCNACCIFFLWLAQWQKTVGLACLLLVCFLQKAQTRAKLPHNTTAVGWISSNTNLFFVSLASQTQYNGCFIISSSKQQPVALCICYVSLLWLKIASHKTAQSMQTTLQCIASSKSFSKHQCAFDLSPSSWSPLVCQTSQFLFASHRNVIGSNRVQCYDCPLFWIPEMFNFKFKLTCNLETSTSSNFLTCSRCNNGSLQGKWNTVAAYLNSETTRPSVILLPRQDKGHT